MWCDAVRDNAEIFDLNCDCVVPGFINLCNLFIVVLFLVVMKPLEDISKHSTLQEYWEISVRK